MFEARKKIKALEETIRKQQKRIDDFESGESHWRRLYLLGKDDLEAAEKEIERLKGEVSAFVDLQNMLDLFKKFLKNNSEK